MRKGDNEMFVIGGGIFLATYVILSLALACSQNHAVECGKST
jgi:hypothetical protein